MNSMTTESGITSSEIDREITAVSDQLLGTWKWLTFEHSASGAEYSDITVDEPSRYTLEFKADGNCAIQADCNSDGGQYMVEESYITLAPDPLTLADRGTDSLAGTFVSRLTEVVTFVFDSDDNPVLNLRADVGNMGFAPAR